MQIVQELVDVLVRENENAVFTCQVSHEDVKGEWFRGGEKIKVTSTVKIRQEGECPPQPGCSRGPGVPAAHCPTLPASLTPEG